jgi:hypothetical protein
MAKTKTARRQMNWHTSSGTTACFLLPGFSGTTWKVSCHSGASEGAIGTRSLGLKRNLAAHSPSLGEGRCKTRRKCNCKLRVEDSKYGSPGGRSMMLGDCSQTCRAVGSVKSKDWNYRNVYFCESLGVLQRTIHRHRRPRHRHRHRRSAIFHVGVPRCRGSSRIGEGHEGQQSPSKKKGCGPNLSTPQAELRRDHWQAPKLAPTWASLAECNPEIDGLGLGPERP